MIRKRSIALLATGVLVGAAIGSPAAHASSSQSPLSSVSACGENSTRSLAPPLPIKPAPLGFDGSTRDATASPSTQVFYVNGQKVDLTAYAVAGSNYIQLRELGKLVGFQVNYQAADNSVRITTDDAAPAAGAAVIPTDGSRYVPKAGDVIACDDGSVYTITDVSRWDKSMFASGPVGDLPGPTCDWSSFPEVELPAVEARRYDLDGVDYLFLRNLYESRRMQYTIQNLAGNDPQTSENGKLKYGAMGTPSVRIQLTIDDDRSPQAFWPWRESELERIFNSNPPGTYAMEAWDVYKGGVFQRTEYNIYAL